AESTRQEVNDLPSAWRSSLLGDAGLAGVLAHRREILKAVTAVAAEFFSRRIEPNVMEAMRRTVAVTADDPYGSTVQVETPRPSGATDIEAPFGPPPCAVQ
ncbi:MAG TPA: hypothetical protein VHU90_11470, partial [Galbitalea sp.]|nr:hypothetical protein [Galbitalea sp.]